MNIQARYLKDDWHRYIFNPQAGIARKAVITKTAKHIPVGADMAALTEEAKRATPNGYKFQRIEVLDS
jgi:hypothetical protein